MKKHYNKRLHAYRWYIIGIYPILLQMTMLLGRLQPHWAPVRTIARVLYLPWGYTNWDACPWYNYQSQKRIQRSLFIRVQEYEADILPKYPCEDFDKILCFEIDLSELYCPPSFCVYIAIKKIRRAG
jgi:hypothetical protein